MSIIDTNSDSGSRDGTSRIEDRRRRWTHCAARRDRRAVRSRLRSNARVLQAKRENRRGISFILTLATTRGFCASSYHVYSVYRYTYSVLYCTVNEQSGTYTDIEGTVHPFHSSFLKQTQTVGPDRWLRTGDMATMDEAGNVRIVGRAKELIIRGGSNVYPAEIEHVSTGYV